MTRIYIGAPDTPPITLRLPARLSPGDRLTIQGTIEVYGVRQDQIDVSTATEAAFVGGELELDTVAINLTAELA